MSVINRIEIANFLNKKGDVSSSWEAKMRHLLFNLRGQSTAMSMENGFGKTTMADALIGMLSRNRTLMSKTREKMSPSRAAGPWTHIRVEFIFTLGFVGQSDMLSSAGEQSGGQELWVFGMYGHSDTKPGYYFYRGRFEELPVSSTTADGKLQLFSNDHFLKALRALKVEMPKDRESWLDAISLHISRKELEQLAAFQKEGGADKSQIFNAIKPRAGEKADQAFFYEVLAPQILAGASQGETDESEEFIEELIINSGRNVSELRHKIEQKNLDLEHNRNKADHLHDLSAAADKLTAARRLRSDTRRKLEDQASCLAQAGQQGIPGIPALSCGEGAVAQMAAELAMRLGETCPLVPLSLLAHVTGTGVRKIEEYFESQQLPSYRHDRIDIVYHPDVSWVTGRSMRLYPMTEAIRLLDRSQHIFKDDAQRVEILAQLNEAADLFLDRDTNPFREQYLADKTFLHTLQSELQDIKDRQRQLDSLRDELESRDKEFIDNETVYTDAIKEGLFTEQELSEPQKTEKEVQATLLSLNNSYSKFHETLGRFRPQSARWEQFLHDHGQQAKPADLLQERDELRDELEEKLHALRELRAQQQRREREVNQQIQLIDQQKPQQEALCQQLQRLAECYAHVAQKFPDETVAGLISRLEERQRYARMEHNQLLSELRTAQHELDELQKVEVAFQTFSSRFAQQSPQGLEHALWKERDELNRQLPSCQHEVERLQTLAASLHAFHEQFDRTDPLAWLQAARDQYPAKLLEQGELCDHLADIRRQLSDLKEGLVSPGPVENQCRQLLDEQDISHQPLHEVVATLFDEGDPRQQEWLAQAHNLLFAPVLGSKNAALEVAELLSLHGLAVPVFTRHSLRQAALQPDATLLGAVTGYASRAVQALLDPACINQWQEQLNDELQTYGRLLADVQEQLALYHPESNSVALARTAAQAQQLNVARELPVQNAQLQALHSRLQTLDRMLTEENRTLMRAAERFLGLGGEGAITALQQRTQTVQQQCESAGERLGALEQQLTGDLRRRIDQAEQFLAAGGEQELARLAEEVARLLLSRQQCSEQHGQCRADLERCEQEIKEYGVRIRQVYDNDERAQLQALDAYLKEGGPQFMAGAKARIAALTEQLATAQKRASLKFDRIRAYLNTRDNKEGPVALKRQIAEIKSELKQAARSQESKESDISRIHEQQPQRLKAILHIDQAASRWLKQLACFGRSMLAALPEPDSERLQTMPLFVKAEQYRQTIASAIGDIDAVIYSAEALTEQLQQEQIGDLTQALKRQERIHDERQAEFRAVLQRIQSRERRLFNSTERSRLDSIHLADHAALRELASMITTICDQIVESEECLAMLRESVSGYEDKLNERLSSIIMHAADNLSILQRVAKSSSADNAYFVIDATIVDEEGVRQLVHTLLSEIEDTQKQLRSRKAKNLEVGSNETQANNLQKSLRKQIYRGLFRNVSIRLKHDTIRPHGHLFSFNEAMSEGQREALSLMWLVKLSEFAIERELKSIPGRYRRKKRASCESVIILDGLFSKLSHRKLIEDSLESLRNTRGHFQMIGLIHNPNYENNAAIFPTYLVGNVIGGLRGQGGHVTVHDGVCVKPEAVGRGVGESSLFHLHVDS